MDDQAGQYKPGGTVQTRPSSYTGCACNVDYNLPPVLCRDYDD